MKRQRGRGRKPVHNSNRAFESSGPDVKIRGSAQHIYEKYQQLARDSASGGDRVMAENYLQHAEHYFRILAASMPQGMNPALRDRNDGLARNGAGEDDRIDESDTDGDEGDDDFAAVSGPNVGASPAEGMDQPWLHSGGTGAGETRTQHGGRERGFDRGRPQDRPRDDRSQGDRNQNDRNRDGRHRDDRRRPDPRHHDPRREESRAGDHRQRDPRRREEDGNARMDSPQRGDPARNDRRRDHRDHPGGANAARDNPGRGFPREAPREVSGLERTLGRRAERLPEPEYPESGITEAGVRAARETIDTANIGHIASAEGDAGPPTGGVAVDEMGRRRRPRGRYRPGTRGDGLAEAGSVSPDPGETAAFDLEDPA